MPPIPPQLHFPSPYLRPSSAPSIARAIEMADGARIASFVYGAHADATPVLFLHGNGEEHGIFGPAIDVCVEAGHRVVAIDSRGQGKSTLGSTRLTYELMADDALAVLDKLGFGRVHIVGFSDGAIEALLIARDHPERVASVLSIG
ncbi:MAG: alpha/beta hydrolase, partial [Atopobiaceae bacterium]|nr:alpha/beta hydrolase [Atopobiaceae bacterium]